MLLMTLFDQLNAHKWLYLDKLYEENDLELCVVVHEAKILGGELQSWDNASAYGQIVSDHTCNKYRVTFKDYVAYSVTNETVAGGDGEEQFTGKLFRTYSKSLFLDYIEAATSAAKDILGPYTHYEIVTLNQCLSSTTCPSVQLSPGR